MVLFLLIGSFEKVDQPTPPPPAKKISHAVHEDKTSIANRNLRNVVDNPRAEIPYNETKIRFESLSISTLEKL